jgi:hypothetical protein
MFGRAQPADLLVDRSQFRCERLKPVKLSHLFGGAAKRRRIGKGFGNTLAFDLPQKAKLRVPGATGPRAVACGLAATARHRRYGTGAKVAQGEKLLYEFTA